MSSLTMSINCRLEASNLILRGTPDEASSVVLKGTLVLCLSEPLKIQGIKLRFTGEKRLGSAINLYNSHNSILTMVADGTKVEALELVLSNKRKNSCGRFGTFRTMGSEVRRSFRLATTNTPSTSYCQARHLKAWRG